MIVVIGSPVARRGVDGIAAAGMAVAVARTAAEAGATVQLVGKVGEGTEGDDLLLAVARAGVGHIAMLRDASPVVVEPAEERPPDDDTTSAAVVDPALDADEGPTADGGTPGPASGRPPALDANDLSLALRYLPDYRVVVMAEELDRDGLASVVEAARWAGARLVIVTRSSEAPLGDLPEDATVLESPAGGDVEAFAAMVGRYAAALDAGSMPADAFAIATSATGSAWSAVDR